MEIQVAKAESFYADAPEPIKRKAGLRVLAGELADLDDALNKGGIRQGVDEADAAGAQVTELVKVLEQDLKKLSSKPNQILEKTQGLLRQVLPVLTESYQQEHQGLIRAVSSIRRVQGRQIPAWPDQMANTYAATEAKFTALVEEMRADGNDFFKGLTGTRFDDYVHLLKAQAEGRPIDWQDEANIVHMDNLQSRKLLELRLV